MSVETGRDGARPDSWEELRRRADELAVLNDLARRLAALHDTREVLDEVARQARRLLAVDVAYIMLLHEDRLRIDVVDGSMGSVLRGIELAPGEGLGGEVLRTGRPWWSESYLDDTRFPRRDVIASAAASEQLGGILGVPLVVGDDTLGVLLAAERRNRRFTDHETELLAGLAAHAALALRTADLFERERTAAVELRESNAALRHVLDQRQRAADLRDALGRVVIEGTGLGAVTSILGGATGRAVEVRDSAGAVLAGGLADQGDQPGAVPAGGEPIAVPVTLPTGHVADLVCSAGPTDDGELLRLLQIAASSVAVVIASERAVTEAELRSRGEFVHALLGSRADDASLTRRARALGIDPHAVSAVAVVDPGRGDPGNAATLATRMAGEVSGWSGEHDGRYVVFAPHIESADLVVLARRLTVGGAGVTTTGVAGASGGVAGIRAAHKGATQATTVLLALDRDGDCVGTEEIGIYGSVFGTAGRSELAAFVRATVGPLLEHDRSRGRDLVPTLEAYLAHARHHARTCEVLHIHANTLYQRLDRVTEVLGPSWKDPDRALDLQVALRLHRLMTATRT
ncbi:helix-turn-helix domain-containing protein [Knoellia koreensis]|uniref:GAF domain-containing protein n=1 Tax=Knoellia koreensis TaxID=2730921 RepID=A0A849HDD3_9MICO|nr:helix-turn-helix domain-containing protein [Knoellia sp. DB2414S]NNM45099.1 GAF domain-containing protein [Knoellia sp. DB2414S]